MSGNVLVDFNQMVIANYMMYHKNFKKGEEISILRHMILNAVKMVNNKFKDKYGEIIFCCDGMNNWRKKVFKYYKANRKKSREEGDFDWQPLFDALQKIKEEFIEYMPYKVVTADECEADDVISYICRHKERDHKILIFSSDKDFVQLHQFPNVDQYSPIKKKFVKVPDPKQYTKELIIQGDRSDGIPNVLSSDDTFVIEGSRQKKLTKSRLGELVSINSENDILDENIKRNYIRNKMLIDLTKAPDYININIKNELEKEQYTGRNKILNYFIKFKLKEMTEHIQEF